MKPPPARNRTVRRRVYSLLCSGVAVLALLGILWMSNRAMNTTLVDRAEEIEFVIQAYAATHGHYPTFSTFDTELKYAAVPINPFTERRMRVFRADDSGHTLIAPKAREGHLGYAASPKSYHLFVYGRKGNIIADLTGRLKR